MKKINKAFVALILFTGLVVNPSQGEISERGQAIIAGSVAVGLGGAVLIRLIQQTIASVRFTQNMIRADELELNKMFAKENEKNANIYKDKSKFITSEFPEKIEDRIDALINQTYTDANKQSQPIFYTPQSKIFVLQNIQDFFEFQQGDEFKNFNLTVYEIATKKINELEKMEITDEDKLIDAARDSYLKKFGISASTLQKMPLAEINTKISEVKKFITEWARSKIAGRKGGMNRANKVTKNVNIFIDSEFRALISILAHLYYKQSQKQEMFVKGANQEWNKDDIKEANLEGITLEEPEVAAARDLEARQAEYKTRVVQQSIFSRMRSAWNSWWYGRQ